VGSDDDSRWEGPHYRAHRGTPTGLEGHVAQLLRHLGRLDIPAARRHEQKRPRFTGDTGRYVVVRYAAARELLDLADDLPDTAVVAYTRALASFVYSDSPILASHWKHHRADARRALVLLRRRGSGVLRDLALANEPRGWRLYSWFETYDPTRAQLALLGLAILIGIIGEQCGR
jgi:hypothetical protein